MAVMTVPWRRGCGRGADGGPHTSAHRSTHSSATPAAGDRPDGSACPGAEQTAADGALGGVVRVCRGRRRKHQSGADYADHH